MIIVNIDDDIDVAGPGKSMAELDEKVELPEAPAPSKVPAPSNKGSIKCLICVFSGCKHHDKICCSYECTSNKFCKCSSIGRSVR